MKPSPRERQLIQHVFLRMDRAAAYHLAHVARLLSISLSELRQRVRNGELVARGSQLVRWTEIAFLVVERWEVTTIASALGEKRSKALPPLVIPRECVISLPAFEIEMISALAQRDGVSRDAFLANHLLDLAGTVSEEMEAKLPGFTDAMRWPDA